MRDKKQEDSEEVLYKKYDVNCIFNPFSGGRDKNIRKEGSGVAGEVFSFR